MTIPTMNIKKIAVEKLLSIIITIVSEMTVSHIDLCLGTARYGQGPL